MFIVIDGLIGSCINQSDGTKRKLYDFASGRFFGEMAIIEDAPRSATCWALEETDLYVLQGIDFFRLVFEHPMIALKLLNTIGSVMTSWLDESSHFLNDLVRWGETARRRAVTDELTGLYNRRFLEESLENRFAMGSVGRRRIAVAMLDLDRLHEVNERCGTAAGDQVIIAVGEAFRQTLRDGDIAARLSGDEFAFLLPDTDTKEAFIIAERLRLCVANLQLSLPCQTGGPHFKVAVRASLGVAVAPDHAAKPLDLIAASDTALRAAKEGGRNKVVIAQ
ncbi:GGDEF domain-containing protein [Treponema sp.]